MTPLAKKLFVMLAILLVVYASMRVFDIGSAEAAVSLLR